MAAKISRGAARLYTKILELEKDNKKIIKTTYSYLMKVLSLSHQQVRRYFVELEKANYLIRKWNNNSLSISLIN